MKDSLFEDKYNLDELDFKIDILNNLKYVNINEMVNLMFYGYPTSGKTTKIYALLASIFDKKVYDLKNITFEEDRKSIIYKASIYHIEINPINLGSNEKLFIHSFLKSYVQTKNIGLNIPKIIFIKNVHLLSKQSQMALRKIIEKNSNTAKFIFEVSNLSKIPEPLISRFMLIRVGIPKINDIKLCLKNISKKKNIEISDEKIDQIITDSNKITSILNLKKIFGYYYYYIYTKKDFKFLYYDNFIELFNIINNKKISFVNFQKIRDLVNEMYIILIPMDELLFYLFQSFIDKYIDNNDFIYKLLELTIKCDNNLKKGNKDCLHLEYYIISIIDLIQN